jgi:transposase InsO family protein
MEMNVVTHQEGSSKCWSLRCRLYIQATGKPDQGAFIERFNRTYRDEVLGACVFELTDQVRASTEDWLLQYNDKQPHDGLGRMPPSSSCRGETAGKFYS